MTIRTTCGRGGVDASAAAVSKRDGTLIPVPPRFIGSHVTAPHASGTLTPRKFFYHAATLCGAAGAQASARLTNQKFCPHCNMSQVWPAIDRVSQLNYRGVFSSLLRRKRSRPNLTGAVDRFKTLLQYSKILKSGRNLPESPDKIFDDIYPSNMTQTLISATKDEFDKVNLQYYFDDTYNENKKVKLHKKADFITKFLVKLRLEKHGNCYRLGYVDGSSFDEICQLQMRSGVSCPEIPTNDETSDSTDDFLENYPNDDNASEANAYKALLDTWNKFVSL